MQTINKSSNIAILFGILATATAVILVVSMPKIINYIFAMFWLVTGLLAFYSIGKKYTKQNS
jgi:hypothetical protein